MDLVNKHVSPSIPTTQDHLHREGMKLETTKQQPTIHAENSDIFLDHFPASPDPNTKTNEVAYAVIDRSTLSLAYHDLASQFPYKSTQGNQYILVCYHYDANCILTQPVKNRTATCLSEAWQILHNKFNKTGVVPDVWVIDNENQKH